MQKISQLISLLGGTGAVAKKVNVRPSAISNWKKSNKIPSNKHDAIFELSSKLNVNLDEFLIPKNLNNIRAKILLIICGGIASYKSLEIIRLIKQTEIDLDIVMTKSAQNFITPLLVTSLNEKKCYTDLFSIEDEAKMNHIMLARKPDIILVAPATGNIMAKLANGIADDLASTILLASYSKIILAPSMNPVMWNNIATQENYKKLLDRGIDFINPEIGDMACGENGAGRGPTIENIDPVRHISNKSSGKQGFAIASELSKRGANVTLISGPVEIPLPDCLKIINVTSAQEMFEKTISQLPADVVICSAAVSDWRLVLEKTKIDVDNKIKKSNKSLHFRTVENPDILAAVVKSKIKPKLVIGFSAETENLIKNAKSKLISKGVDLIIANDVSKGKVFGKDSNKVYLIGKNDCEEWDEQSKKSIAFNLSNKISKILSNRS